MWKLILICVILVGMDSTEGKRYRKRYSGAYSGGSTYAGAGGSSYNDYDDYNIGGGAYAPDYGFIDPYLFHQQLTAQIAAEHAAINNAIVATTSTGDATVFADATLNPAGIQIQHQLAQNHFDTVRKQQHYKNKGYKTNRYAPNYAAASGSVGPGGHYQTAFISPENPGNPNVVNRFSSSSGPGGFHGVSVSSFSSSSDINGKRTNHRGAQTVVNDNGKITSYRVQS